jgi:hypothetical protein
MPCNMGRPKNIAARARNERLKVVPTLRASLGEFAFAADTGQTRVRPRSEKVKAGQWVWHNAESHSVENTGKTEVHVLD